MSTTQALVSAGAVALGVTGYASYARGVRTGRVTPHAVSWAVWTLVAGITAAVQLDTGGGIGAATMVATAMGCAAFTVAGCRGGLGYVGRRDVACGLGALVGLAAWPLLGPLAAIVVVAVVDLVALAPTLGKAWEDPRSEGVSMYAASAVKFALALTAMQTLNLTTVLSPVAGVVSQSAVVGVLLARRRRIAVVLPA